MLSVQSPSSSHPPAAGRFLSWFEQGELPAREGFTEVLSGKGRESIRRINQAQGCEIGAAIKASWWHQNSESKAKSKQLVAQSQDVYFVASGCSLVHFSSVN